MLADTAAVYTIHPTLASTERMTSIEFKVNFLAGATPDRGLVVAQATLIRKGRSVAVVQVDVRQGDTHVATGLFTYIDTAHRRRRILGLGYFASPIPAPCGSGTKFVRSLQP